MNDKIIEEIKKLRNDPLALDEFLFSTKYSLVPHQRYIFRAIENHQFTFIQSARATAKTYTTARYIDGYALRFPDTTIIISGPSYRQSRTFWKWCRNIIFNETPFGWTEFLSRRPTESTDSAVLSFRNGSRIVALPASHEKIHGERGQVVVFTEFFIYPEDLYSTTVLPMLAKTEKGRRNKVIYETTSGFQFQFSYQVYKRVLEEYKKGNKKYGLVSITFPALLKEGWEFDLDIVNETRAVDEETYLQQYHNKWLTDSGTFYILSLMMREEIQKGQVLLRGRPGKEYVMALDTARSSRGQGDDSTIAIVEVGAKPEIVYLWSVNNITANDLATEVNRRLEWFPGVTMLIVDPQGGGEYVIDSLRDVFGIIRVDEDIKVAGRRLITPFVSTSEQINLGHQELRSAIENGDVITPAIPEDEDPNILLAHKEIEDAYKQLAALQTTRLPSGYLRFESPSKRKKDKAYSLLYAHWGVKRILESRKELLAQQELGDPVIASKFGESLIYAQVS